MNLREFYKKLRSPLGTTLSSLGGLILLVLLCLPLLLRNDAGKLEVNRNSGGEGTYDIQSNIKAISSASSARKPETAEISGKVSEAVSGKEPRGPRPRPFPAVPAVRETAGPCRLIPGFPILRLRFVKLRSRSSTERTPGRSEKSSFPNGMRHTGV